MSEINVLSEASLPRMSESNRMNIIQKQHETLLQKSSSIKPTNISSVLEFLDVLAQTGAVISDPEYRSQLRDIARYWASFVNTKTGNFPIFQLQPFDESTSPKIRITDIEETKHKSSFSESIIKYIRAYSASLVSIGTAVPIIASIVIVGLYLASSFPPLYSVIFGILFTLTIWILVAIPYSYFTTARGANAHNYILLTSRLSELKYRLGKLEDIDGESEAVEQKSVNQIALREAYANYIRARNILQNSSSGLLWVSRTGYIICWKFLHRAEEALIEVEPVELVIDGALHDKLAIQNSKINSRDELLQKLRQAVKELNPAMEGLFKTYRSEEDNKEIQELKQVVKKIATQLGVDLDDDLSDKRIGYQTITAEAETSARLTIREVRRALNDFRDHLWEGLVHVRNRLLGTIFVTGFVTQVLLCIVILIGEPTTHRDAIMAATIFYIVGAITGLFGSIYQESMVRSYVDDYGLSLSRLILSPLLSGLAGVGGVLIFGTLIAQFALTSVSNVAQNIFVLNRSDYIIAAALFGLMPNLIMRGIQKRSQTYISALQSSKGTEEDAVNSKGKKSE